MVFLGKMCFKFYKFFKIFKFLVKFLGVLKCKKVCMCCCRFFIGVFNKRFKCLKELKVFIKIGMLKVLIWLCFFFMGCVNKRVLFLLGFFVFI